MIIRKIIPILIVCLLLTQGVLADGYGTSGANWLRLGLGVRATGMSGHYTALADDVSAMYWNPAGLAQIKSRQIDLMQVRYLADITYMYCGGVYPLGDEQTIGVYYYSLSTPQDKVTTYTNQDGTGEYFKNEASVIDVSYGRSFSKNIKLGVSGKMINESLAGDKKGTFAADVGLLYKDVIPDLHAGVVLQNIGPGFRSGEDLSTSLRLGLAYQFNPKFVGVADVNKPLEGDIDVGVGGEYKLNKLLAIRSGFNSLRGLSLGLGLFWQSLNVNYAYAPYQNDLGDTHRMSLSYDFDYKPVVETESEPEGEIAPLPEQPVPQEKTMPFINDDTLFDSEQTSAHPADEIIRAEQILTTNGMQKLTDQLANPRPTTNTVATDTKSDVDDASQFNFDTK